MGDEHEAPRQAAEISWQGRLDGGKEDHKVWRGKISATTDTLKARLGMDETDVHQFMEDFKQRVDSYYIPTSVVAQVRCIDGRTENDSPSKNPLLGPQVSGGTPVVALTYRLARFDHMKEGTTIQDDLEEIRHLIETLELPYRPGAHEDEHSVHSDHKTGCGAIDNMLDIIEIMQDRELIHGFTKAITGDHFDQQVFEDILTKLKAINEPAFKNRYFMKDRRTGAYKYANSLIEQTKQIGQRRGKKAVEKLLGEHHETLLGINTVPDTTLNRDQLSKDTNHLAQVFNYDFWFAVDRAEQVFADDEPAKKTVIISQAMYAVATAMALTDGSLEYGVRQPAQLAMLD
jgi:hypothetical protein